MVLSSGVEERVSSLTAAAYYPDWSADSHPPESLDYSKFDLLYFAFAIPNASSGIDWDDESQAILKRLVKSVRESGKGTKVALSIGGWGGSHYFSSCVSSWNNRKKFVEAAVNAVNDFNLDGIDIDWEYPNSEGAGNPHSGSDAANLLRYFTELRNALGWSKIISTAVSHLPWLGPDGVPLKNVSGYADQLTTINIMNYDVWGASSSPGPNAPLSNACGNSKQPQASATAAVTQWSAAGFPVNKMLLGLALYGYVSKSRASRLSDIAVPPPDLMPSTHMQRVLSKTTEPNASNSESVQNDGVEEPKFLDGNHARSNHSIMRSKTATAKSKGDLSSMWGQQISFKQLVDAGALTRLGNGTYGGANGYTEGWDDCSDTPFIFNHARSTVVTYDDTYSLADKAAFARQKGMKGCFTWSLDQDDGYTLQTRSDSVLKSKAFASSSQSKIV